MLLTAGLAQWSFIVDDLRIQFLSKTVVRVEQKGPKGFEDRLTFTVRERKWPTLTATMHVEEDRVELRSTTCTVVIPKSHQGVNGVRILSDNGQEVVTLAPEKDRKFLPGPRSGTSYYTVRDTPRMVPPKGGYGAANDYDGNVETSGYDVSNNADDIYLILTPDYRQRVQDFLKLTGKIPLMPRYAFGFWDSRWFPYHDYEAIADIETYADRKLPLDVFVIDTDWRIGGSKGYTPEAKYFPDMPQFLRRAHQRGVRIMANDHPEPQFDTALDPRETAYRVTGLKGMLDMGLDIWWFDRNWSTRYHEPMPGIAPEVWGSHIAHDVTLNVRPNQRPMIMANVQGIDNGIRNYAPHPAFHRYPIYWTGDTSGRWNYLEYGVRNAVDGGVESLLPYMSEDVGGHMGQVSAEYYARFIQFGALSPIARIHCTAGINRRIWNYGPEAEGIMRDALQFRYRLIPTLYTAARQAYDDGTPILRRLDLEFPAYAEASDPTQYLLGPDLLVAPIIAGTESDFKVLDGLMTTPDGQPGLKGEYWDNIDLKGEPKLTRIDPKVDMQWSGGGPGGPIPNDNFSARWTGKIGPMPRTMKYRFGTLTDDGARLWIDGKQLVNSWIPQDHILVSGEIELGEGKTYDMRIEFYEGGGQAWCQFGWWGAEPAKETVSRSVWIPPGTWVDLWSGAAIQGPTKVQVSAPLHKIPLFVRSGAAIFLGADVMRSDEQLMLPLTACVYMPAPGTTLEREIYEDDGLSNDYQKSKGFRRKLSVDASGVVRLEKGVGSAKGLPKTRTWTIRVQAAPGYMIDPKSLPKDATVTAPVAEPTSVLSVFQTGGVWVEVIFKDVPNGEGRELRLKQVKATQP
ncbi:MAG: DUF5110 domain-containing protein [Armatimonadetes bacterium]|nr:DUF5110 domain-containing protein [Armatimonadota bacterium]